MSEWYVAKTLQALKKEIERKYPNASKQRVPGGWYQNIGDSRHRTRRSDHNPASNGAVRAADIFLPHKEQLKELAEALRQGRSPLIKYVIFDRRMFSSYKKGNYAPYTWRPYSNAKVMPHTEHIHLSVLPRGDQISEAPKLVFDKSAKQVVTKMTSEVLLTSILAEWMKSKTLQDELDMTKQIQAFVGTKADGIVGPNTRSATAAWIMKQK